MSPYADIINNYAGISTSYASTGLAYAMSLFYKLALPDIQGEHLCKKLKKDARTQHIPVLFLTVKNDNVIECFLAGASGYENKPTSKKMLLNTVENTFDDPGFMYDYI